MSNSSVNVTGGTNRWSYEKSHCNNALFLDSLVLLCGPFEGRIQQLFLCFNCLLSGCNQRSIQWHSSTILTPASSLPDSGLVTKTYKWINPGLSHGESHTIKFSGAAQAIDHSLERAMDEMEQRHMNFILTTHHENSWTISLVCWR